jgi:hypothetical protein
MITWTLERVKITHPFSKLRIALGAVRNNNIPFLEWVLEQFKLIPLCSQTFHSLSIKAASTGSLPVLYWLQTQPSAPTRWDFAMFRKSIFGRHFHVVQWLSENSELFRKPGWEEEVCNLAAQFGAKEILKWAVEDKKLRCSGEMVRLLAKTDDFETLKWALKKKCPISPKSLASAAEEGKFENMKILRKYGATWNYDSCSTVAGTGNSEILRWALSNGCTGNDKTFSSTLHQTGVTTENLEILRLHGVPMDLKTIGQESVLSGSLLIVKWAFQNGARKKKEAFACAMELENLEMMEYLFKIGCPWKDGDLPNRTRNPKIRHWLLNHGCPWDHPDSDSLLSIGVTPLPAMLRQRPTKK